MKRKAPKAVRVIVDYFRSSAAPSYDNDYGFQTIQDMRQDLKEEIPRTEDMDAALEYLWRAGRLAVLAHGVACFDARRVRLMK